MIGTILDGYRITAQIGEGGMARVYRAVHVECARSVAVKALRPDIVDRIGMREQFLGEMRLLSQVHHPGLVRVFRVSSHGGAPYALMELLTGESLRQRLCRPELMSIDHAVRITHQLTDALSAVHAAGIVHRDIKPENMFLVPDAGVTGGERVKLLDFGVAKQESSTHSASTLPSGLLMGTPRYMAPEQCHGAEKADHHSDLYALGCVLFEMLIGDPPFTASDPIAVIAQHWFAEPTPVRVYRPAVPCELEALVARLLAKIPHERPYSARILGRELGQLMDRVAGLDECLPVRSLRSRGATAPYDRSSDGELTLCVRYPDAQRHDNQGLESDPTEPPHRARLPAEPSERDFENRVEVR